eukprot:CAMPEP_0113697724 /NCGR_PEP_ID=MMETSP0038_2-20120614/22294_1 /TAXON_ID=2898 /ORGANISM="Cryptomonas paramecium" /LENGTH=65 /DNA_ID=CAMNT_0000620769 /DNA_START=143 /DNA_END=337 /DNA_ORIENTATION=- /assembly_acc=CAM_ASM_000170
MDPDVELRVRNKPSLDGEELYVVRAGDTFNVCERRGDWLRIDADSWVLEISRQSEMGEDDLRLVE